MIPAKYVISGPEVIKLVSYSTQLSVKFSLLVNMTMQNKKKIVGIFFYLLAEKCLARKKCNCY